MAALLISLGIPGVSQAYLTTAQSAKRFSDTTALFTVTYRFGFLNREAYLPISAVRNLAFSTTSDAVGYTLLDGAATNTPVGTMNGLVLSSAEIRDGMYYLPAGKAADFTLVAALTTGTTTKEADYALTISSLPFYMIDDRTKTRGRLNPSELQYYTTPEVELNSTTSTTVRVTGISYTYTLKTKE